MITLNFLILIKRMKKIAIIGAGNMGGAIAASSCQCRLPGSMHCKDKDYH